MQACYGLLNIEWFSLHGGIALRRIFRAEMDICINPKWAHAKREIETS